MFMRIGIPALKLLMQWIYSGMALEVISIVSKIEDLDLLLQYCCYSKNAAALLSHKTAVHTGYLLRIRIATVFMLRRLRRRLVWVKS